MQQEILNLQMVMEEYDINDKISNSALFIYKRSIVEHRIQDNMSTCLKMKREATRNMDMTNKQFMCGEVEATLQKISMVV